MPKFKNKVIRKAAGGAYYPGEGEADEQPRSASPGMMREGIGGKPIRVAPPPSSRFSGMNISKKALDEFSRGFRR